MKSIVVAFVFTVVLGINIVTYFIKDTLSSYQLGIYLIITSILNLISILIIIFTLNRKTQDRSNDTL